MRNSINTCGVYIDNVRKLMFTAITYQTNIRERSMVIIEVVGRYFKEVIADKFDHSMNRAWKHQPVRIIGKKTSPAYRGSACLPHHCAYLIKGKTA